MSRVDRGVTIESLRITGSSLHGLQASDISGLSLNISNVEIDNNPRSGIVISSIDLLTINDSVVTGNDENGMSHQNASLYVMNLDGSGVQNLTPDLDRGVGAVQWNSDGTGLYYAYNDAGKRLVAFTNLAGNAVKFTVTTAIENLRYGECRYNTQDGQGDEELCEGES